MSTRSVRRLLQQWFLEQVDSAPNEDPRRTSECLSFAALEQVARGQIALSGDESQHVKQCAWCRQALDSMVSKIESVGEPDTSATLDLTAAGTWPQRPWTEAVEERIAAWLKTEAEKESLADIPSPAHFDSEGTLRVHAHGLGISGPALVSLKTDYTEVVLARGEVADGVLEMVKPMPALGLRNLEVPRSALRIALIGEEEKDTS